MGYTIVIGQKFKDEDDTCYVGEEPLANFKDYGEPTGDTNTRWPSYTAWSYFISFMDNHVYGFKHLFMNSGGLMHEHPSMKEITQDQREFIQDACEQVLSKYKHVEIGYDVLNSPTVYVTDTELEISFLLVRVSWLFECMRLPYDTLYIQNS